LSVKVKIERERERVRRLKEDIVIVGLDEE
jgi:hypothetical protein